MTAYYNEVDPYCCQWLRNLIDARHIAAGDVDERSIEDVTPNDVRGYTQCHFFAGIGVWSYAMRLAGWPDDRPVWTGSCPCQPFSQAGKGAGFADERHLWPAWFHLIRECRPSVVFGEQSSAGIRHGWVDLVRADLEGEGYACAHSVLGAHGVGAPHIRQRAWFVADADENTSRRNDRAVQREKAQTSSLPRYADGPWNGCEIGDVADLSSNGCGQGSAESGRRDQRKHADARTGPLHGGATSFWSAADWIHFRDDRYRPVEPGTFPLATGATARVGRLRAYGNAIVPQVAAQFIGAYMTTINRERGTSEVGR